MPDALERVLELVAEGRLSAEQAAPILDALSATDPGQSPGSGEPEVIDPDDPGDRPGGERGGATSLRIEVIENGRKVVNLRIPVSLGRFALDRIPGLSVSTAELVRRAIAEGRNGTLLHVDDDDGDGVRIALD